MKTTHIAVIATSILALSACHRRSPVAAGPVPAPQQRRNVNTRPRTIARSKNPVVAPPSAPSAPLSEYMPENRRTEVLTQYEVDLRTTQAKLAQAKAKAAPDEARTISRAEAFLVQAQAARGAGNLSEALTHIQRANILLGNLPSPR